MFKGRVNRSDVESYRPISLCSFLGKLLAKIVQVQLTYYLDDNKLLYGSQHGYTNVRSTLTNMLCFDAALADVLSRENAYDIIAFDFKKAFDKALHRHVLEALRKLGVCGTALKWFASFLSGRTQQVRIGSSLSTTCDVTSGILQGSIIGPISYTILIDPLLRQLSLPSVAFANDVNFLANVTELSKDDVQAEVDIIANWS